MIKLLRGKIGFCRLVYWYARKGFPTRLALTSDIDITVLKRMPTSTVIGHPYGITIGKGSIIGCNVQIGANVTIGVRYPSGRCPMICDNVFIGNGAIILGDIVVNQNVKVGAGAIVLKDVPEGVTVAGVWK